MIIEYHSQGKRDRLSLRNNASMYRTSCKIVPRAILWCLLSYQLSCAPSINGPLDLDHSPATPSESTNSTLFERAVKLAPTSSMKVSSTSSKSLQTKKEQTEVPFAPSDRIWGSMLLPAQAVKRLREGFRSPLTEPYSVILYGDSHTQGGYLGDAIAQRLHAELNQASAHLTTSENELKVAQHLPGFMTVDHPIKSAGKVKATGHWLRQNWLYRGDVGPFGPLGIAFTTQDKSAKMSLTVEGHQGLSVTVYFEKTGTELPFCLVIDQEPSKRICHRPLSPTQTEIQDTLGQLSIDVEREESVSLHLSDGSIVSDRLMRQRTRSRKALKKKRARIKRRYPRRERERYYKRLNTPKYASDPRLIFPSKAYLQIFGFDLKPKEELKSKVVQVHSMGVRGATIWSPAKQSDQTLSTWIKSKRAKVIATWFGTNTAARESGNLQVYADRFRSVLRMLKSAAPEAVCLVITPPDFGRRESSCFLSKRDRRLLRRKSRRQDFLKRLSESRYARVCAPDTLINPKKRGRHRFPVPEVKTDKQWDHYKQQCEYRAPSHLESIASIQREIGLEEGCVVFDTIADMGGLGSIKEWACAQPERWAQLDLVHLSARGYERLGDQIARGLLSSLDDAPQPPLSLGAQLQAEIEKVVSEQP